MMRKKKSAGGGIPLPAGGKPGKKVALVTVPCLNLPEGLQLKGGRSMQLRKNNAPPPTAPVQRKPVSRKSTSKSVKQGGSMRVGELSAIMATFKELKVLHEQSRSKSRSPASCKSRSSKKHPLFPHKRKPYATLATNPNSEVNLTLKLQRTLQHLNQTDFFRDQDSLPIKSTSDLPDLPRDQMVPRLSSRAQEEIDLAQLRSFCSTVKVTPKGGYLSLGNYAEFKQNRAALKIQRAWKRYQTRRLVERYVFLSGHQQALTPSLSPQSHQEEGQVQGESSSLECALAVPEELLVCSQQLYGGSGSEGSSSSQHRIRHISNLQQLGGNGGNNLALNNGNNPPGEYEQAVKRMKLQQLQKWNQIIQIISNNRSDSPHQLERLLQVLTHQSELNKKDLEKKTNSILAKTQPLKQALLQEQQEDEQGLQDKEEMRQQQQQGDRGGRGGNRREYSSSDHSLGLQQYDSKKYIEYLDGDIFPQDCPPASNNGACISKRKQQLLLQQLRTSNLPIKLGESALYRSESARYLNNNGAPQTHRRQGSSRSALRKSTSEKVLRSLGGLQDEEREGGLGEGEGENEAQEINLDLLTREFLQGSDPSADNFDMVYSEEKLRAKLAELSRLKEEFTSQERVLKEEDGQGEAFQRDQDEQDDVQPGQLRRSQPSLQLHQPMPRDEIKIQDGTPQKPHFAEMSSPSDSDQSENQRGQACATAILNTLMLQALRDIARSDRVSAAFKAYSLSLKPKVRKQQGQGRKKKGFPTSKAEIQLFLEGLLRYLNKEQPLIFRNLLVPTGPSALQMLRYMHQSGQQQCQEQSEQDEDESNVMVIPNRVFDAFWQLKQRSIVVDVPEHFDPPNAIIFKHQFELLKSFNKIFYRSLFDTFNQCLDCQRNFGQYGRPFPWKRAPLFHHPKPDSILQTHVQKARKRMIQTSITYCGLIIQREDMGSSINEEYVKQVHEDRLSRMLAADLIQAEDRWIFYDDEETEILVEIANGIYTEMLIEVIEEVYEAL